VSVPVGKGCAKVKSNRIDLSFAILQPLPGPTEFEIPKKR
jgi:hypothetical protein